MIFFQPGVEFWPCESHERFINYFIKAYSSVIFFVLVIEPYVINRESTAISLNPASLNFFPIIERRLQRVLEYTHTKYNPVELLLIFVWHNAWSTTQTTSSTRKVSSLCFACWRISYRRLGAKGSDTR